MLGVDWMRQVWTGYVRCGLHVLGVDWLCQVKTGCGRCGVDVVSAACVRCGLEGQVWTGCVRCGLHVSGVDWKVRWSGCVNIQTRHQLLDRKQLQT